MTYSKEQIKPNIEFFTKHLQQLRMKQQNFDGLFQILKPKKWIETYGGEKEDRGLSVEQTNDGGYIITGHTYSFGKRSFDIILIKTNRNGRMVWQKTFGGESADIGQSVKQTSDGGFIITGSLSWDSLLYLIKTDRKGNKLWDKTFGGDGDQQGTSVEQTADGGYIITGYTSSFGAGKSDVWLIRTDEKGNKIWDRTFGGTGNEYGSSVQQTKDGNYIITGFTDSFGAGENDVWLIKVDSNGEKIWDKTIGGENEDRGYCVQQTADDGFIITGLTYLKISPDLWLIKTDSNGIYEWDESFGGNAAEFGNSVQQTRDGGYIIAGIAESFSEDASDAWLIKTDCKGKKIWDETYGKLGFDFGDSVQQTRDGGYILSGGFNYGPSFCDVWLIKTDSQGRVTSSSFLNLLIQWLFQKFPNLFPMLRNLLI
jgi:hypothetical protein